MIEGQKDRRAEKQKNRRTGCTDKQNEKTERQKTKGSRRKALKYIKMTGYMGEKNKRMNGQNDIAGKLSFNFVTIKKS